VPPEKHAEAEKILRGYSAHMAALDGCFEKLLQTLERLNLAEDTIVVFTSDHGDMMLSQGLTTKLYPWDESLRIPFLLRYPKRLGWGGAQIQAPLNQPDIMPTLLSLCELNIPSGVQGIDRSAELLGRQPKHEIPPALLLLPVPITEARRYGIAEYRGIRTTRHTYVRSIHGAWLLYDNQPDPYQMHNLIGQSGQAGLRRELDRLLNHRLRELNDDFLPAKAYIEQAHVGHYKEVNVPIGYVKSPWGDWESTLKGAAS
jgi:arylsulfatase A-like enzyme